MNEPRIQLTVLLEQLDLMFCKIIRIKDKNQFFRGIELGIYQCNLQILLEILKIS